MLVDARSKPMFRGLGPQDPFGPTPFLIRRISRLGLDPWPTDPRSAGPAVQPTLWLDRVMHNRGPHLASLPFESVRQRFT